jgi:hypothetical protein
MTANEKVERVTEGKVNGWNRMQLITTTCPFHLQGWSPDAEHSARMAKARSTYFRSDWRVLGY